MKYVSIFILFLLVHPLFGQTNLPVIKATSKRVAINDGGYLDKNAWSLSPKIKPDIFTADRTRKTKWVTFYTDIDSIKVKVRPGTAYNFIVLLNGKDSCYTQIASAIPAEPKRSTIKNRHDTIPFTLTAYSAIHVKAIINNRDTLNLHFDTGSFNFRLARDAILKKTKLMPAQPDSLAGKTNPDFSKLEKITSVQLGKLAFANPEVVTTSMTAHEMDGRFGYNLFEGRVVEIDYTKSLLIIHSRLPKKTSGYARSKLKFSRSFVCMEGTLEVADKKYTGDFLFDTGSDQALILDSNWVSRNRFPKDLTRIQSSVFSDPRGVKYETKVVRAPRLKINNFLLTDIPTYLLGSKNPVGFEMNYFGNDLLKRFDTIIDFKNDYIYLKPNALINQPYRRNS